MTNKGKIHRMILYRQALRHFKSLGFKRVFSYNLAKEASVSPEQVRKDFSDFSIRGNKKAGYDLEEILSQLDRIFQKDQNHNVIIIGMGHIGTALSNYEGFRKSGINIKAGFDIHVSNETKNFPIPILPIENLSSFVKQHNVRIGILAVPYESAQSVTDLLVDCGIKGIMNFTYANLRVPPHVHTIYVSLTSTLESLIYLTN